MTISPTCPRSPYTIQSWQSPATLAYLLCSAQVRLVDRAGETYVVPEDWTAQRKLQLLDIHLQNWDQPLLVPAFTRVGFHKTSLPPGLHSLLLASLQPERAVREPCLPSGHLNCLQAEI